jgi:hypothetical protein
MKKMTPDERLLAAIFGHPDPVEKQKLAAAEAARVATLRAETWAEAELAAGVATVRFGGEWRPAMYENVAGFAVNSDGSRRVFSDGDVADWSSSNDPFGGLEFSL